MGRMPVKTDVWIVVNRKGSVRSSKKYPSNLKSDEIAFNLKISLPYALFDKPRLSATVTVPDDMVKEEIISENMIDNIGESLRQTLDMDISINVSKKKS